MPLRSTSRPAVDSLSRRAIAQAVAVVAIVGALGIALNLQGWRSRPHWDEIHYIDAAHTLLSQGRLPAHGHLASYGHAPPGTAWVILPGVWLGNDLRLVDVPGTVALHFGTLIGIFLLARACFGVRTALFAVLLYGVGEQGFAFAAGGYPPKGHPFFFVWIAYGTCLWVARRNAWYLAAALLTWVVGMLVFLEMAPALFILPVVWAIYRPPVRVLPLAIVGALGFLLWLPYLRFEATRGFADITQVLRHQNDGVPDASLGCPPRTPLRRWENVSVAVSPPRTPGVAAEAGRRMLDMTRGLVVNFGSLRVRPGIPGMSLLLLAKATLAGLTIAALLMLIGVGIGVSDRWVTTVAITLLLWAALANEVAAGWVFPPPNPLAVSSIRDLQLLAAMAGAGLLYRRPLTRWFSTLASRMDPAPCEPRVLALALAVPWAILLCVAEQDRDDRFVGLWPLQATVLAFFISAASTHTRGRLYRWVIPGLTAALVLANPFVGRTVREWRHTGWAGNESAEFQVADALVRRIRAEGREWAVVGYQEFAEDTEIPPATGIDRGFGGFLDMVLEYRHGFPPRGPCWEGASADDEYRVVEQAPFAMSKRVYYLDVPPTGRLRLLEQVGTYRLYKVDRNR